MMTKKALIAGMMALALLVCFTLSADAASGLKVKLGDGIEAALPEPLASDTDEGTIQLRDPELTLLIGKTAQVRFDTTGEGVFGKRFTYESSDPDIASVSERGLITAVGPGSCLIKVTSNAKPAVWAKMKVMVAKPVRSIALSGETWLRAGEKVKLSADIEPDDATVRELEWKSSSPEFATVDQNGTVTGVKRGTVTVSAAAKDGSNARGTIKVSVTEPATGVRMELNSPYFRVGVGEMRKAQASVLPRYSSRQDMTWKSSDENVATVVGDKNEVKVYAHAWGLCTVTGTTVDGGFETSFQVIGGKPSRSVEIHDRGMRDFEPSFTLHNVSNFTVNGITIRIRAFDKDGNPLVIAEGEDPTVLNAYWKGELAPEDSVSYKDLKYEKHAFDKARVDHYLVAVTGIRTDEGYLTNKGTVSNRYDIPEKDWNWRKCK